MLEPVWLLAGTAVLVASVIQAATGAGLGLIAGPALLIAMGSADAVHVAVVLNLLLSLALLPGERHQVPRVHLAWLAGGALAGLPVGVWLLRAVDLTTLKLLAGAAVTAGGIQILRGAGRGAPVAGHRTMGWYGAVAGAMTAALAIPGPVALLGLARAGLAPAAVRAALRAFFVFAYVFTLGLHAALGLRWPPILEGASWMLPFLVVGACGGVLARGRISDAGLRAAFLVLLLAMGGALLYDSLSALA